ncbi:MAG: phenylalanine--tRNA ligase subunit alpha [Methanomassiliicoccales archaeon]
MNPSEILEGLSYPEKKVLLALDVMQAPAAPEEIFQNGGFEQMVEIMNATSWLSSKGLVVVEEKATKLYGIKNKAIVEAGLPERKAMKALAHGALSIAQLETAIGKENASLAVGWLRRKGLADVDKSSGQPVVRLNEKGQATVNSPMADEALLERMFEGDLSEFEVDAQLIAQLKSRQDLITERLQVSRRVSLTALAQELLTLGIELKEEVAQLTPELIQSGKWRDVSFRRYDIRTFAPCAYPAKKHPLTRIADEVRRIFVEMGFSEIDDEYVQPAFWNMDALFTPQDHPARDLQDTFYLKTPARLELEDEEVVAKVKAAHENGGDTGSLGWRYQWSRQEAERALLRTHTTVNTIKYLSRHKEPPLKVFSLSRIFRNEAIDMTHLPEFVQIEGIIMEEDASFDMLVKVLKDFYGRMGFDTVRVRPGPFPYTEPSLEVDILYNGSWMELGGAGVFRPEVTGPLGIKHPVIAFGLGFERLTMLKWNLKDIRELYVTDMDMLRQSTLL